MEINGSLDSTSRVGDSLNKSYFDLQCRQTKAEPGDGIDNDCDGEIDEETKDGKDNDADKYVDEDLELVILCR